MAADFSHMADEELVPLVDEAFAELESRYLWLINSIVRRLKGTSYPEDDDLRQAGLLGLYDAAMSYKPRTKASFKTYAAVCISNRIKNEIRSHSGKKNALLNESVSLDDMPVNEIHAIASPELLLEGREAFEAVLNQIHISLSDFEREVLALYLSGYKRTEIAERLCISVKAFDNAIQRVRKKLKAYSSQ